MTLGPTVMSAEVDTQLRKEMFLEEGVGVVLEFTGVEASAQTGLYALAAGGGNGLKTAFQYASRDYEIALDLLESGVGSVTPPISSTVRFEQAFETWERTGRGEEDKNLIEGGTRSTNILANRTEAYARRGVHWTFDAQGILRLINTLRSSTDANVTIHAPGFDHAVGDPLQDAIYVSREVSFLIVEGNYIALGEAPWNEIGATFDESWFAMLSPRLRRRRL
ncbi:hypothetical protein BDV11DRAFT_168046 [Aspergillus similis]